MPFNIQGSKGYSGYLLVRHRKLVTNFSINIYFQILIICFTNRVLAQKPPVDTSMLGKWPYIDNVQISNDGKYSMFTEFSNTCKITVVSNVTAWKLVAVAGSISNGTFSANSKFAIFKKTDSLLVTQLGNKRLRLIPNVNSFKLSGAIKDELLAYMVAGPAKTLIVQLLNGQNLHRFQGVKDYSFSNDGKILLLKCFDSNSRMSLKWVDCRNFAITSIWSGFDVAGLAFDKSSGKLAFFGNQKNDSPSGYRLFYYTMGAQAAISVNQLDNQQDLILQYGRAPIFNRDGSQILFSGDPNAHHEQVDKKVKVDIWNYKDEYPQSEQMNSGLYSANHPDHKFFLYDLKDRQTFLVSKDDQHQIIGFSGQSEFKDHLLLSTNPISPMAYYKKDFRPSYFIYNCSEKTQKPVLLNRNVVMSGLTPDEKYIIWFDTDSLSYFSYQIQTGITRNITKMISEPLYDTDAVAIGRRNACYKIAGCSSNGAHIFLYDKYDIWQVSLDNSEPAVNLTNGYGRTHDLTFSFGDPTNNYYDFSQINVVDDQEAKILVGYDHRTKYNGFWTVNMPLKDPIQKIMGPYCFFIPRTGLIGFIQAPHGFFLKAKDTNKYLVTKMSASEFPNIYLTDDFRSFHQITDLHPEKGFNWITSELVNWRMADGRMSQGILYKPQNFDPNKKYPVIFNYYEKWSDNLNQYITPEWISDLINVPYFVSNGYLMFYPDIYYKPGHDGDGVINAVVSAAKYLCMLPYVDSTRLGLQGHSFAGWETNYLITHSRLFAAACEGAGVSDQLSAYDELQKTGFDRQELYEIELQGSPYGLGVTPWTAPAQYFENSPVFFVKNVTTPLLIMQGDADPAVPFSQSIEMYLAMKRAEKKVWLLQYEGAGHNIGENGKDYTIRMKQFFDYYLKGAPPPVWMTRGVPASLKGIDSGLETDTTGMQP